MGYAGLRLVELGVPYILAPVKLKYALLLLTVFSLSACGGGEKSPGYSTPGDPTAGTCNPNYSYPPNSPCSQKYAVTLRMDSKNCPAQVKWSFNGNTQSITTQTFNMGSTLGKGMSYSLSAQSTCPSNGQITVTALINGVSVKSVTQSGSTVAMVSGTVGQ